MVDKKPPLNLPSLAGFVTFRDWLIASTKPHGSKALFAKAANTSPQVVSTWISRNPPSAMHLRCIAAYFDLSFPALLLLAHADPAKKGSAARTRARLTLELLNEWHYVTAADAASDVIRYITTRPQRPRNAKKKSSA